MKRLVLVCSLFALTGCAALQQAAHQQVDYYQLCEQDEKCLADKKAAEALVRTLVGVVFPGASAAAGLIAGYLFGWWKGRKKAQEA